MSFPMLTSSAARYQILAPVGEGAESTAAVYRALAEGSGLPQVVALKSTTIGRARHEARLLAELSHPCIPRFFELVPDDGQAYVAMEFIEGETLAQTLQSSLACGKLPPRRQVLGWGVQLCDVLDYLHRRVPPITFRDVKPGNVMRAPDGRLVLIDFDVACSHLAMREDDFPVAGTPGYMAPEQLAGAPSFSPLSDVYGLGATLCHLLTGNFPPRDMREVVHDPAFGCLPPSLQRVLLWMTERDPRRRPARMRVVRAALNELLPSLRVRSRWVTRLLPLALPGSGGSPFPTLATPTLAVR